ncbi:MAG: uracil-DNA glycosylase [Denitrovibrio sp.]|nr:MAG: uracil-DNA glycosylase [Denitrovibrio sp.]
MGLKRVNCRNCIHYFVTWDENFPYGCKAYQFKTTTLPSIKVFRTSGIPCQLFARKSFKK